MVTITIPKKLAKKGDLVLIPREEYENLLRLKKIREFKPTVAQKKSLREARKEFARGEYITLKQLEHELGSTHR